jgi:hypothetical protein
LDKSRVRTGGTASYTRCCSDTNVVTRPLVIRFTSEPHPRAVLHVSPRAEVDIEPGSPAQKGPLYYDEGWACRFSGGIEVTGVANWGPEGVVHDGSNLLHGNRLQPGCARPIQWNAIAGWLNVKDNHLRCFRGVRPGSRGRACPERRRTVTDRGPGASPPGRRHGQSGP